MKHTKAELLKNHYDSKKFDCYDKLEIELVDLLLKEHKQLLLEKTAYKKSGLSPERVQELAKAEAEGRLVVLPCKVGDELWLIRCGEIRRNYAHQWHLMNSPEQCFLSMYDDHCGLLDFGKTVFLTREAAEKALGGAEG